MSRLKIGLSIVGASSACVILMGMASPLSLSHNAFVTKGLNGEMLSGDDCLAQCVGCPFHNHSFFYKYALNAPTAESDGKGIFPVFYGGDVISRIGDHRDGHLHQGIDIASQMGSTVVAAWTGKVFFSGWNSLGGWAVILKHENGYVTYYAHLKENPKLYPGQNIIAGQRIGAVGMTGNAKNTIPHLHFEISQGTKKPLNPLALL